MNKAKSREVALLFVDASHFVMGCDFLGYVYGKMRHFVRTCSGRKRYNVLGALDFVTKKLLTITNDTYITASQVCELLRKVAEKYVDMPVYLVLDNASYQRCRIVFELAEELGINLIYIPPYSPNLNLIERLWKFLKGKLRTQYYDDFDIFRERIDSIADSTDKECKHAIDRLISDKVQLFDDVGPVETNPHVCRNASVLVAA
jgi:transposase